MKAVDTTFLIDLLRGDSEAAVKARKLDEEGGAATTEINVFEIVYGIYSSQMGVQKTKMARAEALLSRLEIFPLNHLSALTAAKILGKLTREGQMINVMDGLIAGILLAHRCKTIVTRNVKDFSRVPGILPERY